MFCPNCGQQLREGACFCPSCGNRVNANAQSGQVEQEQGEGGHFAQYRAEATANIPPTVPVPKPENGQARAKQRKGMKKQTKVIIIAVACAALAIAAVIAGIQFSRMAAISSIDPSNVPVNKTENGFEVDAATPILPAEEGLPQSVTQISKVMATEPSQLPSFIDSQGGSATTNSTENTNASILSYKIELNSAIRANMDPNSVFLDTKKSQVEVSLLNVTASDLSKGVQPGGILVFFYSKWFNDETMSYFIKVNDLSYASAKAVSEDELSQAYCGCFTIGEDTYYWVLDQCRSSKDVTTINTALYCYKEGYALNFLAFSSDGKYSDPAASAKGANAIASKLANASCDYFHEIITKK